MIEVLKKARGCPFETASCKIEQRLSATVSISGGKWTDPGSQNLAGKATTPAADKLSYDFTRTYDLSFGGDPDDIHAGWKVR